MVVCFGLGFGFVCIVCGIAACRLLVAGSFGLFGSFACLWRLCFGLCLSASGRFDGVRFVDGVVAALGLVVVNRRLLQFAFVICWVLVLISCMV